MVSPYSEFFIEKPLAKNKERIAKGLIYLPSRFKSIIKTYGSKKAIDGFELKEIWTNIVGYEIGKNSFPIKITKNRILNIMVNNSANITYIKYNSENIIKQINTFFGKDIVQKINITKVES